MRGHRLALDTIGADDLDRWRALARRAADPNPYFEPELVMPATEHLGDTNVSLVVVEDDQGWQGCLPVRPARLGHVMPTLRTWRHPYCFLGTPLLDSSKASEAAHSLLELLLDAAPGSRFSLEQLTVGGAVEAAVKEASDTLELVSLATAAHDRALLVRRDDDSYLEGLRSHHRRELNRLRRRLEGELGAGLEVLDVADDADAIETFLTLEGAGWKGRGQTSLDSSPGHADFFRSVCNGFASDGRLELLAMRCGSRTVAMKCNLYAGDGGFCFKIAYDETLARFSPGVQLERANVRHFHNSRSESWQDSCADPQNDMINRLWPDRRRMATTLVAPRRLRSVLSRRGLSAFQAVQARERKLMAR